MWPFAQSNVLVFVMFTNFAKTSSVLFSVDKFLLNENVFLPDKIYLRIYVYTCRANNKIDGAVKLEIENKRLVLMASFF
jgi:hypothetical protein